MRIAGKGVREFRKATDDIKREFQEGSSGILTDLKSISNDLSNQLTREIDAPIREATNETVKTFDEYKEQYNVDYYYDNKDNPGAYGNEYQNDVQNKQEAPETQIQTTNGKALNEPKSET
jgi:Sec-independent protein translocase protein TatA